MSTTATTSAARRVGALGRAETTLLWRNRTALFTALALPVLMMWSMRAALSRVDLARVGTGVGPLLVTASFGFVLLFGVYLTLVPAYVARREDLVLKRLRTGEPRDQEILAGTALPSVVLALAQMAVLAVAGVVLLRVPLPRRPELLVVGVVLGTALVIALAAATTAVTRSVEMAQLTTMPVWLVSVVGSGLFIPLELLPHTLADACRVLPLTPVMTLIQVGWRGGATASGVVRDVSSAVVWIALAVFAVRRWFRWEPRR
jgi:ABC-2 type transport system permease protein